MPAPRTNRVTSRLRARAALILCAIAAIAPATASGQLVLQPVAASRIASASPDSLRPVRSPARAPREASRRAWIVAGTVATAAFGAFTGWALADEDSDASCLGGETRSTLNGAAAGAVVGLPMMLGLMALDDGDAADRAARDSIEAARQRAPSPRGWGLVRYKARSTLVATAGSLAVGAGIGTVAGTMAHLERPRACRGLGHAIGDGSASYGGAMVGLTVPMAVLFDWPH